MEDRNPSIAGLSRVERAALSLAELANDHPIGKRLQTAYLQQWNQRWMLFCVSRQLEVHGLEHVDRLTPPGGILLCSNHRSFFDMYVTMSVLTRKVPWIERMYFPVRANFFYESWAGIAVNTIMGGLCMYPPMFRRDKEGGPASASSDETRRDLNRQGVERITKLLDEPGTVVGMHPEGTRGKGPDPYTLLPAQPGTGQMIMRSKATVVPAFINGLGNDLPRQIVTNFLPNAKQKAPIVLVFGKPVQFGDLLAGTPRPAQYKRVADRVNAEISALGEKERAIRARIVSGSP